MAPDSPNASWHPAFMPNAAADIVPSKPREPVHLVQEESPFEHIGASVESQHEADGERAHGQNLDQDGWFPDYGKGSSVAEVVMSAPAPASKTTEPVSPIDTTQPLAVDVAEKENGSSPYRHSSTMSFARTVSHEVNWNDDEDPEWNLPRTGTDPFKFMPPNGRTDSFPAISPVKEHAESHPEHLLPSSQAEDIMNEVEQEEQQEAEDDFFARPADEAREDGFLEDDDVEGVRSPPQQYIGGDLHGTAEEAAEARYAEGVPLIPHDDSVGSVAQGVRQYDPFSGDAEAGEDDFFNQVHDAQAPAPVAGTHPGLERKSTTQFTQNLDSTPTAPSFEPLQEDPEEANTWGTDDAEEDAFAKALAGADASNEEAPKSEAKEDLADKWKEMFADEEDFLLDDSEEKGGFLGSDDEGLLDDTAEPHPAPTQTATVAVPTETKSMNGRYLPPGQPTRAAAQPPPNPYLPTAPVTTPQPPAPSPYQPSASVPPASANYGYPASMPFGYSTPPPQQPEATKAQSFSTMSKGGYHSPYDLPMEVVKPKKRVSMQNLQRTPVSHPPPPPSAPPPGPAAPPRSVSYAPAPMVRPDSVSSITPPSSSGSMQPQPQPSAAKPASPAKPRHESFFEELPVTHKVRPGSRHSNKSMPSPSDVSPYGPPQSGHPLTPPQATIAPPHHVPPPPDHQPGLAEAARLVAPDRVSPYAALLGSGPSPSPPASNRYSPAPPPLPHANGSMPAVSNRYSPAPSGNRPHSSGHAPGMPHAPAILPFQPRTSSPLARPHMAENGLAERRSSSSQHEPRLQRVPSLPQVEEEDSSAQGPLPQISPRYAPPSSSGSNDGRSAQIPHRLRQTPPPPPSSGPGQNLLSPPKRSTSNYHPVNGAPEFAPPPRSQTQSPGALHGHRVAKPVDPIPRPSSVHSPASPRKMDYAPTTPIHTHTAAPPQPTAAPSRPRGFSLNLIPPTDGREKDPLERWKGSPLVCWGVGGTILTMFPKDVPRYGMNQSMPMNVRSPGEVKIKNVKDITPLEERLSKFPGPLKGKSKKKETIAWMTTGIEGLERGLPTNLSFQPHVSHDLKRSMERVLLWKILRLFIEHDGTLEGNPAVEKAVRDILSPNTGASVLSPGFVTGAGMAGLQESLTAAKMQSENVDSSAVEQIRLHLFAGDREKAVWAAADKRLWGHAMLIANTTSPDLYKQVAQEFVKKEVNFPGHNNESLAALYAVLSGNHEESVDELVPVHARAGLQLIAKDSSSGVSNDSLAGLDKWRETLGLILSNRSAGDARAINSLGSLLSGYGRAEAAHICFLFARTSSVFGGLDDPNSNFVLVGSDHRRQTEQFAKEIEPLLLSEVYEYGLSLAGGSNVTVSSPHLAGYKLQHALALAEYGYRDKALQYCEAINNAINAQTRRAPYHHTVLETAVDDLMKRLKQAPRDDSGSWISKPSMNKVSDSVWNRFNKFVSGDDNDSPGQGSPHEGVESGPFARIAGGTPTISRSPSTNNLETFGTVPGYPGQPMVQPMVQPMANGPMGVSPPTTRAGSRYAPAASQPAMPMGGNPYEPTSAYAPRSSMERTSGEISRSSFEMPRQSSDLHANPYAPSLGSSPGGYQPYAPGGLGLSHGSYMPTPPSQPENHAAPAPTPAMAPAPPVAGYSPVGYPGAPINGGSYMPQAAPAAEDNSPVSSNEAPGNVGYQPPSYGGFEPPSMTPYEEPRTEENEKPDEATNGSAYEPPSYQPYSYEPPSYEPTSQPGNDDDASDEESKPKPKKKGIMYDDDDDMGLSVPKTREKSKEEKDRENAEMFRRVAEEEAKRDAEAKAASVKKGWGLGSWFGGKKEAATPPPQQDTPAGGGGASTGNKPIRAKLGEANSFYYDPDLKRWVNKNAGADDAASAPKATPPPPRASTPRAVSATPPLGGPGPAIPTDGRASAPPMAGPPRSATPSSMLSGGAGSAPPPPGGPGGSMGPPPPLSMMRSASNMSAASGGGPPSRPGTALSTTSSIDDLLAVGPKKTGGKKARKGGRYVDVMAKQ